MDCSPPGSSVHGILQARILEWVAMPSSRGSSLPRDWTQVSCTSGGFFTSWTTREDPEPFNVFNREWVSDENNHQLVQNWFQISLLFSNISRNLAKDKLSHLWITHFITSLYADVGFLTNISPHSHWFGKKTGKEIKKKGKEIKRIQLSQRLGAREEVRTRTRNRHWAL